MGELLLELFSEEIPARMQAGAARDLGRMAREHLTKAELAFGRLESFCGPRRLTLVVDGLPQSQADRVEERKGPRLSAPPAAIEGFMRSAGVARENLIEHDGAYHARAERAGRPTPEIVAEMAKAIVTAFPWPKSMKSAAGALRWVRPLHRILCVFDGGVVAFAVDGLASGDTSEGHRVMGPRTPFRALSFDDYRDALAQRFVILDGAERERIIVEGARALCTARGLVLVEDDGLLEEVAGMVEWPVPLMGAIDEAFLSLPPEVIRTSMRVHQRYFAVRRPDGELAPHFIAVANIEASDGGAMVAAGNARVLAARLSDARFFWDEDRKTPLEHWLERLKGVTFHAKLGSMYERALRIEALVRAIAPIAGADADLAGAAARLAKTDLASAMVGEFPELQGVMGAYYAKAQGLDPAIAEAIGDHYKPQGPGDRLPATPAGASVALADKLDTLIGFFAIGERPTGSRDPFALRRCALGVIRIVLDAGLRLPLRAIVDATPRGLEARRALGLGPPLVNVASATPLADDIVAFFADRLKVMLREEGRRHDLVDAVFVLGDDDLTRIVARIEALTTFLGTDDGANLLAGFKRATNILAAEAKKGPLPAGAPARAPGPPEEAALFDAVARAAPAVADALAAEDFTGAMAALAALRAPVDAFFDKVLVNSPEPAERDNRLRLLASVGAAMGQVSDFSLVAG